MPGWHSLLIVASVPLSAACAIQPVVVDEVARAAPAPEWEALFQRTDGWTGGDGAATVVVGDRVVWLFADSWIGPVVEGRHGAGSTIVRNAIAVHPLPKPGSGEPPKPDDVKFYWGPADAGGKPTAWLGAGRDGEWLWPAGGGGCDIRGERSRLVLFFARMGKPDAAREDMWNFEGRGTGIAIVDNPVDPPAQWRPVLFDLPDAYTGRVGLDTARRVQWGAAVYFSSVGGGGTAWLDIFGVDSTDPLNKKLLFANSWLPGATAPATWYIHGAPEHHADIRDAKPIAERVSDELSVSPASVGPGKWWVMIYSEPMFGARILARTAEKSEGPWSEPVAIYTCPEPARDKRLFVYGAKAHLELSKEGELLVSYCVNSHDFWHMAGDADIYRPRFVRVPRAVIEKVLPQRVEAAPAPVPEPGPRQLGRPPVRSP